MVVFVGYGYVVSFSFGKKKGVALTLNLLNCAVLDWTGYGIGTDCTTVVPSLRLP